MLEFKGLEFAPNFEQKSKGNLAQAQKYIDNQCMKYLPNYTPISMDKGYNRRLKKVIPFTGKGKMSKSHVIKQPGLIINTEPKARKEYYTNKGFSGKPRGKFWFERMKADHKDDILRGLNNDKANN